ADLNTNLLANPGFENVTFTPPLGNYSAPRVLEWAGTDGFAYSHDGSGGIPDYANGGPLAGGGSFYFTPATPGPDITAPGQFYQDIDVSTGASGSLIAAGTAAYRVGAFFNSYQTQGDFGTVHVDFRNAGSTSLGTATVTSTDLSTWTQNFRGGLIPVGTATVRVSLFGTPVVGSPDGYMDNIDFQVSNEVIQPALAITIDRDTGALTLSNQTGSPVNLKSYSITSAFEALEPTNWRSVADNYDAGSPGPNQLDPAHHWSELTDPAANGDLSEADLQSGAGFSLAHTRTVNLGNAGTWIQNPTEDIVFQYISGNQVVQGLVNFTGHGGAPFATGDLNVDSSINSADWMIFRTNQHADLSGFSLAEAYRRGDLNGDRLNNHPDFVGFKTAFDTANGAGAFDSMLASVPEPATSILLLAAGLFLLPAVRRGSSQI
ncbi:MAG TPA: hypothetical protein VGK58_18530, partial [Lacipirellulaceae bacterium]